MKITDLRIMRFYVLEGINVGYGPGGYVRSTIGAFENEWYAGEFYEKNCVDEYYSFDISPVEMYITEEDYENIFKKNNKSDKFKLFYGECIIGTKMGWHREIPERLGIFPTGSESKPIFLEELAKEEERYCSMFDESVAIYIR